MRKTYLQLGQWSDTELIAAVESFDAAAYTELQERHTAAARTFATQLVADPADIEAIVAGTFAQLHNVLQEAAGPKVALRPYLFTAVRWAAHDHLSSRQASAAAGTTLEPAVGIAAEPPAEAARPSQHAARPPTDVAEPNAGAPERPEDAAERPEGAAEEPATAAEQPASAAQPPATAAEQRASAAQPPATAAEQPASAAEQPASAAEPPRTEAEAETVRSGADGAAQPQAPDDGEPLFTDPAIADLVRSPLYRAFRSLPERLGVVLWHTEIEQTHPALTATILGLSLDGVEDLAEEARDGLRQACLQQHLADVTREDCSAALAALGTGAEDGPVTESAAWAAQQHLAGCADCRAAAAEITGLRESLQRVVAPVFLGSAASAYLSAAKVSVAGASLAEAENGVAGPGVGGLRWTRQHPARTRRRTRPPAVLVAGGAVLCVLALTGFALAAVSNTARPGPLGTGRHAAAAAPAAPAAGVPGASSPTPSPTPFSETLATPSAQATTPSPAPNPTTPVPTTPVPTTPAPTPTPCPTPKHCRLRPCRCPTPPPPL